VDSFRRRYGLHASSGILFNHESPRRPDHFVTRKITRAAAAISLGLEDHVTLGNLEARRDWGFAGDYVRAMWLMLQQDEPDDYVIGTGEARTVRDLVAAAFAVVDLDWREYVRVDESLLRGSTDAQVLLGDPAKACARLGWTPEVSFDELVSLMVNADLTSFSYDPASS
jgi:GDPmannose 4,6-dehydratase